MDFLLGVVVQSQNRQAVDEDFLVERPEVREVERLFLAVEEAQQEPGHDKALAAMPIGNFPEAPKRLHLGHPAVVVLFRHSASPPVQLPDTRSRACSPGNTSRVRRANPDVHELLQAR